MSNWTEEELRNIIWGEDSEADDHTGPYPKGNEEKSLLTNNDQREKQYMQEAARHVKLADQTISGGTEIDSWPETPLINVACEGEYRSNVRNSVEKQVSAFGNCVPECNPASVIAQLDDGLGLFGNEFEVKDEDTFLDYNWNNIESFDDLDNIFRNDDPIYGPEGLCNGELWGSSTDLFTSPINSVATCSPNSGVNASLMSQQEVKPEFVQPEELPHPSGFGGTIHLNFSDTKDTAGKECFHFEDPSFECVGGNNNVLLEEKVNENEKLLKCPPKEETGSSVQVVNPLWTPSTCQFQSSGSQFTTISTQSSSPSVNSQKQPVGPEPLSDKRAVGFEPLLYWQTPHQNSNLQHQYPMMSPLPPVHFNRENHQRVFDYGNSPGLLNNANPQEVFPVPVRPPIMTPEEKLQDPTHVQQMKEVNAIQEQHQFDHKAPYSDVYNSETSSQENQRQDTEGSAIDAEENPKTVTSMELNTPIEQNDSNTIPMVIDDCSLEEKEFKRLLEVIEKLDIKVRLGIRDSLFRLAQSAMQKRNDVDTSSTLTNNTLTNVQSDGVVGKIESYDPDRLARIQDVEKETNPVDRIIAHMLFHRPLKPSAESLSGVVQLVHKPNTDSVKSFSAGCVSDCSIDKQQSYTGFDMDIEKLGKT